MNAPEKAVELAERLIARALKSERVGDGESARLDLEVAEFIHAERRRIHALKQMLRESA